MVVSFVSVPLLLRWLGQENYGLILTALAFMNYLSFADAGLNWGSIILISEAHGRGDRTGMANVFRHAVVLATASASLAITVALSVFWAARHGWRLPMFGARSNADGLVLVVALQCAVGLVANTVYAVFQGSQEGHWVGFYQGCARIGSTAAITTAAYFFRTPALALSAGLVVIGLCGAAAALHASRAFPWIFARGSLRDVAQYRRQLRTGAKSFGLQLARTIQGTTPVMVISSLAGPAAVPLYSVPATMIGTVFGVFNSWNMSIQAAYGASWAAHDRRWVVTAFRRTLDLTLLLGMTAVAGFTIVGPAVIVLWTRGSLHPSTAMCASVATVALVQAVSSAVQFCLVGINQHRSIAIIETVHTGCVLACATLATIYCGPAGIGLGIAVAYGTTASWLGFRDLARRLGSGEVVPRLWWVGRILLVGAAGVAVGAGFVRLWPSPGTIGGVAASLAGAILASGTVVFGTVLLRIHSVSDWMSWTSRAGRTPRQIWRGIPEREAVAVD
jgi:O-antigen/teichoic acid export membrane protein